MSITFTKPTQHTADDCYKGACLSALTLLKADMQEEEPVGFATIDGHMVHHVEVTSAVNKGAGIFIGDYFVGLADSYHSASVTAPFIRY